MTRGGGRREVWALMDEKWRCRWMRGGGVARGKALAGIGARGEVSAKQEAR